MTATVATRKRRGAETQETIAHWYRQHGWPYAESAGAGRPGCDITGLPGLAVEVKARRAFNPLEWIRQARGRRGVPYVIHRPDGLGPASVAEWPVTMRLADHTELLRQAGYGDPDTTSQR